MAEILQKRVSALLLSIFPYGTDNLKDQDITKARLQAEIDQMHQQMVLMKAESARSQIIARIGSTVWQMASDDDIEHVSACVREALEELGIAYRNCEVNLLDELENPAQVVSHGLRGGDDWRDASDHDAQSPVIRFWREGKVVYRRDLATEDLYGEEDLHALGVRSVIDIPFSHGTLAINSAEPNAFQPEDIEALEMLAEVLSGAFTRRQDLRSLRERNQELADANQLLRNVHEISHLSASSLDRQQILDTLGRQLVGAGVLRSLSLSLVDQQAHRVIMVGSYQRDRGQVRQSIEGVDVSYDLDDPDILAETVRTGQLQIGVEWGERFTSHGSSTPASRRGQVAYFVPIKAHGQVIAVVATGSTLTEQERTTKRLIDLQPLWNQVAVALSNAALFESAQQEITEREQAEKALSKEYRLHDAENAIRVAIASMDQPQHLNIVVGEIGQQLHGMGLKHDSCTIQILNRDGTDFISVGSSIREGWVDEINTFLATGSHPSKLNAEDYPWVIEVWRTGEARYEPCTELLTDEQFLADLSLIDVAFSHGTLAINRRQPNAFTADDIDLLQRFAAILSDGFQRFLDITERQRLEAELVQAERLGATTELAAGISHNLNNVLTAVLGPAQFLLLTTDDPEVTDEAGHILAAGIRARDLVQRLSDSVRPTVRGHESVELNHRVQETVELARPRWKDESEARGVAIQVLTELGEIPPVCGNKGELSEVILNLLLNAIDAMPDGGTITVSTRLAAQDGFVVLTVADTGIGMVDETRRRVFEPFFTTKTDVGSGLGLSTAHGSVTRAGGTMKVESELERGTTFTICLPVFRDARLEEGAAAVTDRLRSGRILLVEDDAMVCDTVQRMLSSKHTVEVSCDGMAAMQKFSPGHFDMALIDLGLPTISGDRVAADLRARDPALVTVLFSGWSLAEDDPRLSSFDLCLQKPIVGSELNETITKAIALHDSRV